MSSDREPRIVGPGRPAAAERPADQALPQPGDGFDALGQSLPCGVDVTSRFGVEYQQRADLRRRRADVAGQLHHVLRTDPVDHWRHSGTEPVIALLR